MENRFKLTKKAGLIGIFANLFLLIIKTLIGFISNSQAMIADAANSASDIFASLMTFLGNKIASEPSDDSHTFGHGKAEYIFSLFISISMIFLSLKLLYDSFISIINQSKITFSYFLVVVCIITILVKFFLFLYTKKIWQKYNNILIESNMKDHRNDCILTTFTLISILLTRFNIYLFDGIVGFGISFWIFLTGIKIFIESYNVLMDISIDDNIKKEIMNIIYSYIDVKKVDKIYSIPTGYKYIVVFTIYVDGKMTTYDSHKIADDIQINIENNIEKIDQVIIHVNPL